MCKPGVYDCAAVYVFNLLQLPSTYQTGNADPGGYMALRSNATGGFDTYDNPNKASVGHGYDVPRSSKTYTNRQMPAGRTIRWL